MRKIAVIAGREYRANVRSKAFLISLLLMPALMGGGMVIDRVTRGRLDLEERHLVVSDPGGKLLPALKAAIEEHNRRQIFDPADGRQVEPRFRLEAAAGGPLTDEQRLELSQQIRKRQIHAFAEIDPRVLTAEPPPGAPALVRVHTESVASRLHRWLTGALNDAVHGERLRVAGLDRALVERAMAPVQVEARGLYVRDASGRIKSGDESSRAAAFMVPIAIMLLLFMAIMMSQTMLQSTLEEKQQRIAEVLLGSARPFELMMGKLLGGAAMSLTMVGIYLTGGGWMLDRLGYGTLLRTDVLAWVLLFQILGVVIYGSIFTAIGAACSDLKEAQSLLMPVMLVLVLPLTIWFKVLEEPLGSFATGLSFVPLWTPMLMPLRLAATAAVPLWQPVLGAVGATLAAVATTWAGGRVFRVGLLIQGKPPRLRTLMRWIVRG